jgi:hypothetical protein
MSCCASSRSSTTKSNCQDLWIKIVLGGLRLVLLGWPASISLPLTKGARARTSATRWGWLTVDGHQDLPTGGHEVGSVAITDSDQVR